MSIVLQFGGTHSSHCQTCCSNEWCHFRCDPPIPDSPVLWMEPDLCVGGQRFWAPSFHCFWWLLQSLCRCNESLAGLWRWWSDEMMQMYLTTLSCFFFFFQITPGSRRHNLSVVKWKYRTLWLFFVSRWFPYFILCLYYFPHWTEHSRGNEHFSVTTRHFQVISFYHRLIHSAQKSTPFHRDSLPRQRLLRVPILRSGGFFGND